MMEVYGCDEKVLARVCFNGSHPQSYLMFPVHIVERTIAYDHPQSHIPCHWHEFFEISCVIEGIGIQRVADREYELRAGDLCIVNKGTTHMAEPSPGCVIRQIVLKFLPGYLLHRSLENADAKHLICLLSNTAPYYYVRKDAYRTNVIMGILSMIIDEMNHKETGYEACVFFCIQQLAIMFFRDGILDPSILDTDYENVHIVGRAIRYIEEHFPDHVSLSDTSGELNVSYSHLSRLFKRQTGWGFSRYVNFIRICAVEKLLAESDMPITSAVMASGFSSLSNFNRVYKQLRGYTPTQFIQRVKKQEFEPSAFASSRHLL